MINKVFIKTGLHPRKAQDLHSGSYVVLAQVDKEKTAA